MELKTKVHAPEDKHDVYIKREFELPLHLLFRAYVEADLLEQWMGTKVIKLESKKQGSFQFETTDPRGNTYKFSGCIHDVVKDQKIVRTFEFENTSHGVQLEFLTFEKLSDDTSKLTIHSIYQSPQHRAEALKMPFAYGLSMAHNRLQEILQTKNNSL